MHFSVLFVCVFVTLFSLGYGLGPESPSKKCPGDEHLVLYCPQKAEPTCEDPTVHDLPGGGPCDVPQCFCNRPNVRNTKTDHFRYFDAVASAMISSSVIMALATASKIGNSK